MTGEPSAVFAVIYILMASFGGKSFGSFTVVLGVALLLGLACIWFGDVLGGMQIGYEWNLQFSSMTPGSFVRFVGWLLLVPLPIAALILQRLV